MKNTSKGFVLFALFAAVAVLLAVACSEDDPDRTCHVTLVCNAAPGTEGDVLHFEVQAGELLTGVPGLTREGFEFAGWYTDQSSANNQKASAVIAFEAYDLETMPIYLDITLYGRWVK